MSAWSRPLDTMTPALGRRSSEDLRSDRSVVGLTLVLLLIDVLSVAGSLAMRGPNPLAAIISASLLAKLLTPPLLRVGREWAVGWLLGVVLVNCTAIAWLGYGPQSPAVVAFLLFPVTGLMLAGSRVGLALTAVAAAQIGALLAAHQAGYVFPFDTDEAAYVPLHTAVQTGALFVTYGFLHAYERRWMRAVARAEAHAEQLQEAARAKERFLAQMSHELRTPLNAVIGYTELVLEEAEEHQHDDLARVHQAGAHLLQLVDELLNLEKIASGQVELRPEEIDLHALGDTLVAQVQVRSDTIVVRNDVPENTVVVSDPVRVRQVLANLLSNAVTFTPQGQVVLSFHEQTDHVALTVSDTGVGMSDEDLQTIFEPFRQGTAGKHQGTGLGLAISRSLAELLGGSLTAISEEGVGSAFRLTLPRKRPL